LGIDWN
jgi:hypothetical protein